MRDADVDRDGLETAVKDRVTENLSGTFRPVRVHVISALPRTQTGKMPRGVIESVYLGDPVGDVSTLDGADALEEFPTRSESA